MSRRRSGQRVLRRIRTVRGRILGRSSVPEGQEGTDESVHDPGRRKSLRKLPIPRVSSVHVGVRDSGTTEKRQCNR